MSRCTADVVQNRSDRTQRQPEDDTSNTSYSLTTAAAAAASEQAVLSISNIYSTTFTDDVISRVIRTALRLPFSFFLVSDIVFLVFFLSLP